jgi:hypothetical protein
MSEIDSVTLLCPCGQPAKRMYCSGACRQKAYRTSEAHIAQLARLRGARAARRKDYEPLRSDFLEKYDAYLKSLNRYRAISPLGQYAGQDYGGAFKPSVPRLGNIKLGPYMRTEKL